MHTDTAADVDRGDHPDARTPWEDPGWRAEVRDWIARGLTAHGLRAPGPWRVRLRPWSVLVSVPVEGAAPVWFKANPPASAFESPLGEALARWVPEHVLTPLAVDPARGWTLLPDGGETLGTLIERGEAGQGDWEAYLRQYAHLQRALLPHARAMEELGVPGARTADLPELFDRVLAGARALSAEDRRALEGLRPRLVEWSGELAAIGIGDCLDHSDLHPGQLFRPEPGRYTFFDWGDAAVSHPFMSLLVPVRFAVEVYGEGARERLRDAYLEPWTDTGATAAGLRRAADLACRLGALGRAVSWGRLFPGADTTAGDEATANWLRQLLREPS
ncbi:aminoglycoside phosphotransferase family protein [Streptomyces sp. NPDC001941]|uniref:aminoglycoside phosphotransferase family protein n=1 Tax=Streptomyces sp. NPDC001941 TaxID=3154659 RepID=UPI00331D94F0